MNWANAKNALIKDLKDFTATFFQKNTLLNVIFTYSVFDTNNTLLVMRPYQIAATERILWKIKSAYQTKNGLRPRGEGMFGIPQAREKRLQALRRLDWQHNWTLLIKYSLS